jgi:hypothetical protein
MFYQDEDMGGMSGDAKDEDGAESSESVEDSSAAGDGGENV